MKKYSKLISVIALMLVIAMMLTACGSPTASPDASNAPEITENPTQTPEPTETPTPTTPTGSKLIVAEEAKSAWDLNDPATWGASPTRIDKNTVNTVLFSISGVCEDVWMDIYTAWDAEHLYIGVISQDNDIVSGDGIKVGLYPGKKMNISGMLDVCITANSDTPLQTNRTEIAENIQYAFNRKDDHIQIALVLKLDDIGLDPTDKNVAFNIARLSATKQSDSAGRLVYGALWGSNSENNPGLTDNNVIKLNNRKTILKGDAQTLIAEKTENWDVKDPATWGEKTIHINKDSDAALLFTYNHTPEDVYMDIYTKWDDEYIYLGIISDDPYFKGSPDYYTGDGIQFRLSAGEKMDTNNFVDICLTLNKTLKGQFEVNEAKSEIKKNCKYYVKATDDKIYMSVAVRFEDIGIDPSEIYTGTPLAFNILRITATKRHDYAGWLVYGAYFGSTSPYNEGITENNRILLAGGPEKPETDDSVLLSVGEAADRKVYELGADFIFGNSYAKKIITTKNGTYMLCITNANIMDKRRGVALNEFSLLKLEGEKLIELGFGYTYNGIPDVLTDADGNIYVVGGGTTWDMDKHSLSYDYKRNPEKTNANVWFYDAETNGIWASSVFQEFKVPTEGYTHAGSVINEEEGKIYIAYLGKNAEGKYTNLEYFTFDIAANDFEYETVAYTVDDLQNIATYAVDGGIGVIYSDTYCISILDAKGNTKIVIEGQLLDTFEDKNGNVNILYASSTNNVMSITLQADGTLTQDNNIGISSDEYAVNVSAIGNKKYIVALKKGTSIKAEVYEIKNDGTTEKSGTFDFHSDIVYRSALMVAPDEDATGNVLTLLFAGYDNGAFDWYLAQIELES